MFNFFFNKRQNQKSENSLNNLGSSSKEIIDNFIALSKGNTEKRESDFNALMRFALESKQWTNTEINLREDEDDVALVFNSSEEYISRYMARLFPRNPHTGVLEIGIKMREAGAEKNKKFEGEILDIYYDYSLADILLEQGVNYLCGGASCFYYPRDPITKRAQIISLDPKKCYLGWSGGRLVQFAFKDYQGGNKYKTTYYDLNNIIIHDGLTDIYHKSKNDFDFIPFSWIPNFPVPHSHEGISKIRLLSGLDKEYNERASDFSKRVSDNTEPPLVILSDMQDVSKIERGRKKKTRLGKDDDMKYLELTEGGEILKWLELVEKRITQKVGIVHSAGATKTNVSGKSLGFQYSDMMDLIGFMRLKWDKAFRQMNTAILSYKYGIGVYHTDPVYQPFLTQDNGDRIDEYATMIDKDLISHKDAIDELRGVENAEEKLEEILAEKKIFRENEPKEKSENNFNN